MASRSSCITNGVHAGFALPLGPSPSASSPSVTADLAQAFVFPAEAGTGDARFLAIGWGDQRIYTETRTWTDLQPVNCLVGHCSAWAKAQCCMSSISASRTRRPTFVPIRIGMKPIAVLLATSALRSQRQPTAMPLLLPGASHGRRDAFYLRDRPLHRALHLQRVGPRRSRRRRRPHGSLVPSTPRCFIRRGDRISGGARLRRCLISVLARIPCRLGQAFARPSFHGTPDRCWSRFA